MSTIGSFHSDVMREKTLPTARSVDRMLEDPATLLGSWSQWNRNDYIDTLIAGEHPQIRQLPIDARARSTCYTGYLTTVFERDLKIHRIAEAISLKRVLSLVAARSGGALVHSDVAKELEISRKTVENYLGYLSNVYLVTQVPMWSKNLSARVTKTPRAYATDTGLAASMLNVDAAALKNPGHAALGGLLETFVLSELTKLRTVSRVPFDIFGYRDSAKREIDFILEAPDGHVVGIEVKASVSPPSNSDRHLRWMREKLGDRFTGIVLHLGTRAGSLGDGIYSMPVSTLWGHRGPQR